MRAFQVKFKPFDKVPDRALTVREAVELVFCVYVDVLDRLRRAKGMNEREAKAQSLRDASALIMKVLPDVKCTWSMGPPTPDE